MVEFFTSSAAQVVLGLTALAILVALAAYVVLRVRPGGADESASASELLTNFRELHAKGELSDAEFRTIKGILTERLQRELNLGGGEGYKSSPTSSEPPEQPAAG